ncbi:MAG: hypothetical protein B7Y88_13800 [Sphingomonadales bacterium 32-64-17]|nr:MAG: hypothetical protein B7Y88_13800 [Sphingomonadales bacterium 32-64-17]
MTSPETPGSNVSDIRAALDHPIDAPPMAQPGDPGPELGDGSRLERPPFPPGCPITPLGISSGLDGSQRCYYLNYNGQLVSLEANNRHGKLGLIALYGPASDWLEANFPQCSKPVYEGRGASRICVKESEIVGFDQAEAARALIEECCRRGIFDPAGKMRGAGAHRQRGGGMVLHCGDRLMVSRHWPTSGEFKDWIWMDPGVHEGNVYTAGSIMPRPWHEPVGPECVAQFLTKLLMSWPWKRKLLDPRLLLGWIGNAIIGGWLPWRAMFYLTGGAGAGKSTLNGEHGVLDQLLGAMQFRTDNTSAAAIRAQLQNSTLPVMLDEFEAGADNRRVIEVLEAARVASSGGKITRSSSEQTLKEFTLRSPFFFSGINIPPLKPQDLSRMAIGELGKFAKDSAKPDLAAWHLPELGRKMMRRMMDQLFRLEATKAAFDRALAAQGHDARACDQFGTLLACADILLHDRGNQVPDDEELMQWADECRPERMAEIADKMEDHELCLRELLTSDVQARGGDERVALESWVGAGVRYAMEPLLEGDRKGDERANKRLQELGLKLVNAHWKGEAWGSTIMTHELPGYLAVANKHNGVERLFVGSNWQKDGWTRSLGRFEGAISATVKFGYRSSRAVLVPLYHVLDADELPNASQPATHRKWFAEELERNGIEAGA